jgi:hypothetical protein
LVGLQDTMVTRLGATQIPVELRENIRQLLCVGRDRALTDPLVDELRGSHPVIWLSVRLDARTPDNQDEFLISLVSRVSRDYPEAAFILDGFSYPDDFGSAIYQQEATDGVLPPIPDGTGDAGGYLSSAMMSREEDISAYVCKLQASLNSLLPNTVVNTSGMRLANAVYLAHLATYYVCHAGTLQHKIAWIYNIRGIVHSNTAGLQPGVRNWLADQLQDGVKPSLISGQYVTDLDSIRTINQVERNRDYHLQDIEKIVDQIMIDMKDSIGSNSLSVNQST